MYGKFQPQCHFREQQRDAVDCTHQKHDASEASPSVRDRVVSGSKDRTYDEHHKVACQMAEGGGPV